MLKHGVSLIRAFCVKAWGEFFQGILCYTMGCLLSGRFVLKHEVIPSRAFCVKLWGVSYQGILC